MNRELKEWKLLIQKHVNEHPFEILDDKINEFRQLSKDRKHLLKIFVISDNLMTIKSVNSENEIKNTNL